MTKDSPLPPLSQHLRASGLQFAGRWIGAEQVAAGTVTFGLTAEGLPGYVHGGLLAALCDELMGCACWMTGHVAPGARTECDFLAPVRSGQAVEVRARVHGVQGRKITTSAEIVAPAGLCVRASGVYVSVQPRDWAPFAAWPGLERFYNFGSGGT